MEWHIIAYEFSTDAVSLDSLGYGHSGRLMTTSWSKPGAWCADTSGEIATVLIVHWREFWWGSPGQWRYF
jgi:hypothetical protein